MKKCSELCFKMIALIGTVVYLFLGFYSVRYTARMYIENENLIVVKNAEWVNLAFLAVILLVTWILLKTRFLTKRIMHIAACFLSAIVVAALFLLVRDSNAYAVSNDQLHVYLAGVEMAHGRFFEFHQGEYFGVYPFQYGLAWIYSLFYRLVRGDAPQVVQYVHAICVGATVYAGFRVTRELFDSIAAEGIYLLVSLLFVPMYLYTLFMYGESISVCGTVFAIWFWLLIKRQDGLLKRIVYFAICAFFLTVAYIARPSVLIVWIAMFIIQVLIVMRQKNVLPLLTTLLLLVVAVGGQKVIFTSIENKVGVEFNHAMPNELLLAMGLQGDIAAGEVPGQYNAYTWSTFSESGFDTEASAQIGRDYIIERLHEWLKNPGDCFSFFKTKLLNQWNEPSFGVFTVTRFMEEPERWVTRLYYGDTYELIYNMLDHFQSTAYILVFVFFLYLIFGRDKKLSLTVLLPGLILVGGFLFSAIWEAKSRYVYPYMVIAMPYVAGGAVIFVRKLTQWFAAFCDKYQIRQFCKKKAEKIRQYWASKSGLDWLNIIIFSVIVVIHGCLMYFLFYRQAIHFDGKYYTDISPYIYHMQGIDTGYEFPYPIMFWVGKFFWLFMEPERAMAVALTVLNGLSVIYLKYYVDKYVRICWKWNKVSAIFSTVLTFSMLFVSMLFLDLSNASIDYRYRGVFSPNPFHNATYLATRPFSIVCFFMMAELLETYEEKVAKKKYIIFSLFCLLTTMAKPSFALGFVVTVALILIYRMIKKRFCNLKMTLCLALCAVPALFALLYQYKGVFTGTNAGGEDTGIGFGWLTAWSTMEQPILLSIVLGLAFPMVVLIFQWKEVKSNTGYRLALLYLAVNLLMLTCLYEKGFRMAHVNFAWGYMHAMSFVFITSVLVLLKATIKKRQNSVVLAAQWALYLWHLVCGVVYFSALLGGSGYL